MRNGKGITRAVLVATMFMTSACGLFGPEEATAPKHVKKVEKKVEAPTAPQYLSSLATVRLRGGDAPEKDVDAVRNYTPNTVETPAFQFLYKVSYRKHKTDGAAGVLLVPAGDSADAADLSQLDRFIGLISDKRYELLDMVPLAGKVAPAEEGAFEESERLEIAAGRLIEELSNALQPPTPLRATELQFMLAQHFYQKRMRDPAYIALENAKQSLADSVGLRGGTAELQDRLSAQIESLEQDILEQMPYRL